ncbi:MAG: hypothetical protein AB7U20_21905 [Planctomycetaceae bacterium]
MRVLKQFAALLLVAAVLVLPIGVMGCAKEAPNTGESGGAASGAGTESGEAGMESDLGEPGEAGSNL